ncbi:hypothetical protein AB1N83_011153 [Pleurotus pulmonarius]
MHCAPCTINDLLRRLMPDELVVVSSSFSREVTESRDARGIHHRSTWHGYLFSPRNLMAEMRSVVYRRSVDTAQPLREALRWGICMLVYGLRMRSTGTEMVAFRVSRFEVSHFAFPAQAFDAVIC